MVYDVIIIGAGMAGMTAAIYASRAGKSVLVLEEKVAGGQIVTSHLVKNYPGYLEVSGMDLMETVRKQAVAAGAEIKYEEVLEIVTEKVERDGRALMTKDLPIKTIKTEEGEYETRTVILAMGRTEEKLAILEGREISGVSYCATCDGALYKDKTVAVFGGGNTALYNALYLSDIAKKVYLIHRRNKFRGEAKLVEQLREKGNVEFVMEAGIVEVLGDGKVEGLKLRRLEKGDLEKGEVIKEDEWEIKVDGLFIAIGQKPATEKFFGIVDTDAQGYIVAGEDCATSCPGVYVAGDCRTKSLRQLVTAAADGAVAATEAVQNLE